MPVLTFDHFHDEKKIPWYKIRIFLIETCVQRKQLESPSLASLLLEVTSVVKSISTAPVGFVFWRGVREGSCRTTPASLPLLPRGFSALSADRSKLLCGLCREVAVCQHFALFSWFNYSLIITLPLFFLWRTDDRHGSHGVSKAAVYIEGALSSHLPPLLPRSAGVELARLTPES